MKFESKFYNELKRNTPQITWTRLENSSVFGTPDLLGYNSFGHFKNTFIMVKHRGPCTVKLYEGSRIMELVACGLELDACCLGLEACGSWFTELGA